MSVMGGAPTPLPMASAPVSTIPAPLPRYARPGGYAANDASGGDVGLLGGMFGWRTADTDPVGFIMDWRDFLADVGPQCHNGDWLSVELMRSQMSVKN